MNDFGSFISLGCVFLNAFLSSPLTLISPGVKPLPNSGALVVTGFVDLNTLPIFVRPSTFFTFLS